MAKRRGMCQPAGATLLYLVSWLLRWSAFVHQTAKPHLIEPGAWYFLRFGH
jgi:hypothetical protein